MGLGWERLESNLEKRLGENEKGKKKEERPLYFEGGEKREQSHREKGKVVKRNLEKWLTSLEFEMVWKRFRIEILEVVWMEERLLEGGKAGVA